jgi:hypothetical protein
VPPSRCWPGIAWPTARRRLRITKTSTSCTLRTPGRDQGHSTKPRRFTTGPPFSSGSGEPRHGRRGNAPTLPGAQANSAFPARGNAAPRRTVTWVCAGWPDAAPAPRAGICPNTGQRFRRAGETSRLRLAKPLRALVTVNVRSGVPLQGLFGGVPRAPSEGGAADGGGTGHACSGCWQDRCRWPATLRRRGLQCSALPRAHRRPPRNAGAVPQRAGTRPRPSCAARTLPFRASSWCVAGCAASWLGPCRSPARPSWYRPMTAVSACAVRPAEQ